MKVKKVLHQNFLSSQVFTFDYKFRRQVMTPVIHTGCFLLDQYISHLKNQKSRVCSIQIDRSWHLGIESQA